MSFAAGLNEKPAAPCKRAAGLYRRLGGRSLERQSALQTY
jgi:hypothetical protein